MASFGSGAVSALSALLSGLATPAVAGTTTVGSWLANQFWANHTMVTTVDNLLNEVLVSAGNSGAIAALTTQILAVPGLPLNAVGMVNTLPAATTIKDLQAAVMAIRQEISIT